MILQILVIPILLCAAAMQGAASRGAPLLRVQGPAHLQPVAQDFVKQLQKQSPRLRIEFETADVEEGIKALAADQCDVVLLPRLLSEDEFKSAVASGVLPFHHPIGFDSLAIIVYPTNEARNIRLERIRQVWRDRTKNWKKLGWRDLPVMVVSQNVTTGAHGMFTRLVMGEGEENWLETYRRYPEKDEITVLRKVQVNAGAIGYVGARYAGQQVRVLRVDNVEYTPENIRSGEYPLAEPVFLLTRGYPRTGTVLYALVTIPFTEAGQKIIENNYLVPLSEY